jgi:hypothetical protein
MMKDTLKLSCFSLYGSDMFITPSGITSKSLSTVIHARVRPAHQLSIDTFQRTLAALAPKCFRLLTLTMTLALPSTDNLHGAPILATIFCLCTMRDTNT